MKSPRQQILITGGAGYIGAHTVHYLIEQGIVAEDIIVIDNLIYGHREHLPAGVTLYGVDLLDRSAVTAVFAKHTISAVIHFAAYAFVGESMEQPGKYFENNIMGGINLLEAMKAHHCEKIIFSSTCAIYGIPEHMPLTEETPQHPINPYGESKLMFERILEWYGELQSIRSIRLRYFNASGAAYGIGESHAPETHLIPLVLETAQGKRDSIRVFGIDYDTPDGTCIRDYIHVLDLASAHYQSLRYLDKHPDVITDYFNLGTGTGTSVRGIIATARAITGKDIPTREEERRPGDPARLIADPTKAKEILRWEATHSIEAVIRDAWHWHSVNPEV